jgi:hypothetical protein
VHTRLGSFSLEAFKCNLKHPEGISLKFSIAFSSAVVNTYGAWERSLGRGLDREPALLWDLQSPIPGRA